MKAILLQLLGKYYCKVCKNTFLFVQHGIKKQDFEFSVKILELLSCNITVIKRNLWS